MLYSSFLSAARFSSVIGSLVEIPEWLDMEKYRRGQTFMCDYYSSIIVAKLMGIIYVYSMDDSLKALIITGQSHTPYMGFQRYLSTVQRVISWCEGPPWVKGTTAYKNMRYVCRTHQATRKRMCQLDNKEIVNAKITGTMVSGSRTAFKGFYCNLSTCKIRTILF